MENFLAHSLKYKLTQPVKWDPINSFYDSKVLRPIQSLLSMPAFHINPSIDSPNLVAILMFCNNIWLPLLIQANETVYFWLFITSY
jgi:hypothetical protein